jgi:hypothetical protein
MTWDDQNDGVWIWYSPFSNSASTHYFWSKHTEAFYPMKFANTELNPLAVRVFDGDDTDDRVIMLGSVNGYVNFLNNDATTDISVNFVSHATLGPFVISSSNQTRMVIKELKALTDADGAAVNYEILLGDTPIRWGRCLYCGPQSYSQSESRRVLGIPESREQHQHVMGT